MSQNVLDAIQEFVAGRFSPTEFRDLLHGDPDAFEAFPGNDPHLGPANYVHGSVFHFLLELDFGKLDGALNAQVLL